MKTFLLGLLLASPPVAAWVYHGTKPGGADERVAQASHSLASTTVVDVNRVAVEVIAEGSAPRWVQVRIQSQAIPEPGVLPLAAMAALMLLRRKRCK